MNCIESGDHQLSFFFLNYSTLCTQVISEGANGPTTPEAEEVLIENKKLVILVSLQRNSKCDLK